MRKFTLFFMSMFLVLGTSVAQDDDEPLDFELAYVTPNSDSPSTGAYNIRLGFSKEVTAVCPEGGIDVVNIDTKEVVKIDRCQVDEWDPYCVVFMFEQKKVAGKDGEEWQDQYITEPGTYSYTIPAGCIKSVDGEDYAGDTFTFTIVSTFSMEDYTPKETPVLDNIVLTFAEEIAEVKMPASGWEIVDNYWMPVANVNNAVIGEDKKTVTLQLENSLDIPGQYYLDLYMGNFVSVDGSVSEYASLYFNVVDPAPAFFTNYEDGDQVQELGNLEITFRNVKDVEILKETITAYLPGGGESEGKLSYADNKITVYFDQKFTEEGEYTFYIPEGTFAMDGVENEARELTVTLFTFVITPLEVVSVTPEVGEVNELAKIVVTYNQLVTPSFDENWHQISQEITLTCGDKKYKLTYAPDSWNATNEIVYLVNAEWNGYEYVSTPITAEGTYVMNLADIVVDHAAEQGIDEWGYPATIWHSKNKSCEGTCTWTIVAGGAGVGVVNAEAREQVVYDILGRRVEKVAGAGIYIVNGKKMVIE